MNVSIVTEGGVAFARIDGTCNRGRAGCPCGAGLLLASRACLWGKPCPSPCGQPLPSIGLATRPRARSFESRARTRWLQGRSLLLLRHGEGAARSISWGRRPVADRTEPRCPQCYGGCSSRARLPRRRAPAIAGPPAPVSSGSLDLIESPWRMSASDRARCALAGFPTHPRRFGQSVRP